MNKMLITDMYQLTMGQSLFNEGRHEEQTTFNMFYRKNPFNNGFAIFAGLETFIKKLLKFKLKKQEEQFLKKRFSNSFVDYLKNMKISVNIEAVKEGTVVFPNETLVQVSGQLFQCMLVETLLLSIINHQTLIATKASRIVHVAKCKLVMEFGLRRAQGPESGVYGARASYIGGFASTSNVKAAQKFNILCSGTMAHSYVMSYDTELEAFEAYARTFPDVCILLIDTFDVMTGLENAMKVFKTIKKKQIYGIRLDSGDLSYLSDEVRKRLDENGFKDALIVVSNDLDEHTIKSLNEQTNSIDIFGVGTKNIVGDGCPALGGVYKMVELNDKPKIKISENVEKVTNPCKKNVFRIYDKEGMIKADLMTLKSEELKDHDKLDLIDENNSWKKLTLTPGEWSFENLLVPILDSGKLVYKFPSLEDVKKYCTNQKLKLWHEYKRFENPHKMKVNLSNNLYDIKKDLLFKNK